MATAPSDAQIIARLERLERVVRLLAERTGADFVTAPRVVDAIGF
jgi:hypothetical protein